MLPLLIRLAVIALIIYVFYKAIRYITDPKRKLDEAYEKGQYYFYDDVKMSEKISLFPIRVLFLKVKIPRHNRGCI